LPYKIDEQRRLFIKKDLIELSQWIDALERINTEFNYLHIIEKQLVKNNEAFSTIKALRRKNTLLMGFLCKYEQQLRKELEYGTRTYDLLRAKEHEGKRDKYQSFIIEFTDLRTTIYKALLKFQRR